jgi:hypothetical protein
VRLDSVKAGTGLHCGSSSLNSSETAPRLKSQHKEQNKAAPPPKKRRVKEQSRRRSADNGATTQSTQPTHSNEPDSFRTRPRASTTPTKIHHLPPNTEPARASESYHDDGAQEKSKAPVPTPTPSPRTRYHPTPVLSTSPDSDSK